MTDRPAHLLGQLTADEKADLVTGLDMWHSRGVERLGVPAMKLTDGPNGARGDGLMGTGTPTACIPSGWTVGASWDPRLAEELGGLLGDEARAKGAHVLLGPTINLQRTPKGGRNFECFSEDPVLTGALAAAYVRGLQSRGVAATPKHFVGNDSEFERTSIDVRVDERALREVYLVPFEHTVKHGGTWGMMGAYNRLNGTFCCENPWLLRQVLRAEWGFDGFVVSDWYGARTTIGSVAGGLSLEMPGSGRFYGRERLRAALDAGDVTEEQLDGLVHDVLVARERTGALDGPVPGREETLDRPEDRALIRRAAAAGTVLLTNDGILPIDPGALRSVAVIGPNARTARVMGGGSATVNAYRATSPLAALSERLGDTIDIRYARGCTIDRSTPAVDELLLEGPFAVEYFAGTDHEGDPVAATTMPTGRFLFFGEPAPGMGTDPFSFRATASLTPTVTGTYAVRITQSGRGRVLIDGTVAVDGTSGHFERGDEFFGFASVEIEGMVELEAGKSVEIVVEYDSRDSVLLSGLRVGIVSLVEEDLLGEAEALAADCDMALVVVGTNDDWETEGRDRDLFELPGDQPELIRRISATNPRTVVVVNTGAVHALDWLDRPAAVLQTGFAGQELGDALVDVLVGDADPGGRMPATVPARHEHHPAFLHYPGENGVVRYGEGLFVGHRWFDARAIEPAVAFGHGLSYATFEWSAPRVAPTAVTGETVSVEIDVTNTSERTGSEVVQIYLEPTGSRLRRPVRELKGFAKLVLAPRATGTVAVELDGRAFAYFDPGDPEFSELASTRPVPTQSGHDRRDEPGWYVEPGVYRIVVARSAADIVSVVDVELTGDEKVLPL